MCHSIVMYTHCIRNTGVRESLAGAMRAATMTAGCRVAPRTLPNNGRVRALLSSY